MPAKHETQLQGLLVGEVSFIYRNISTVTVLFL